MATQAQTAHLEVVAEPHNGKPASFPERVLMLLADGAVLTLVRLRDLLGVKTNVWAKPWSRWKESADGWQGGRPACGRPRRRRGHRIGRTVRRLLHPQLGVFQPLVEILGELGVAIVHQWCLERGVVEQVESLLIAVH